MADEIPEPLKTSNGRLPIPDPTPLTTQQLDREIENLKENLETKIQGGKEVIEARVAAMDKAILLLQTIQDRLPAMIEKEVRSLERLHDEKFASIEGQFIERDVRTEQSSSDGKVRVDAAFAAAKEAVLEQNKSSAAAINKSETSTMKQIDQIQIQIGASTSQANDKIDDVKKRLDGIEGENRGQRAAKTTQETSNTGMVGIISLVIGSVLSLAAVATGIVMAVTR